MEGLTAVSETFTRALKTLEEIIILPHSEIVRDATIQRFEYTFEIFWKFVKAYLNKREGIVCNSPKSCFREAFAVGIISESDTTMALEMTDDRNLTSHAYHEEVAEEIFERIPSYCRLMKATSLALTQS